jgi:hypothetical protein
MKRTLSLKRESLAELTGDELAGVVGAQDYTRVVPTLPVNICFDLVSRVCLTRGDSCINC